MSKYKTKKENKKASKTLNKPFRTPSGPKKFSVYVKNPKTGKIIKVNFGDPNMKIRNCLLYTSPSPRDKRQSRMPSSA